MPRQAPRPPPGAGGVGTGSFALPTVTKVALLQATPHDGVLDIMPRACETPPPWHRPSSVVGPPRPPLQPPWVTVHSQAPRPRVAASCWYAPPSLALMSASIALPSSAACAAEVGSQEDSRPAQQGHGAEATAGPMVCEEEDLVRGDLVHKLWLRVWFPATSVRLLPERRVEAPRSSSLMSRCSGAMTALSAMYILA